MAHGTCSRQVSVSVLGGIRRLRRPVQVFACAKLQLRLLKVAIARTSHGDGDCGSSSLLSCAPSAYDWTFAQSYAPFHSKSDRAIITAPTFTSVVTWPANHVLCTVVRHCLHESSEHFVSIRSFFADLEARVFAYERLSTAGQLPAH